MTSVISSSSQYFLRLLALTLLHSVWQGAAVAGLLTLCLALMRRHEATTRYATSVVALFTFMCLPLITGAYLAHSQSAQRLEARANQAQEQSEHKPRFAPDFESHERIPVSQSAHTIGHLEIAKYARPIVIFWLTGVLLLSLRGFAGWAVLLLSLRKRHSEIEASLASSLRKAATAIGVRKLPQLIVTDGSHSPYMYGLLSATIVLPVSALSSLSVPMVEAILAHELAHIRRHDYFVNIVQCIAETAFFYHPGIWWISRSIGIEREMCCDELVVSTLHDSTLYARALVGLEVWRSARPALAASDGSLRFRIERILGRGSSVRDLRGHTIVSAAAAATILATIIFAQSSGIAQSDPSGDASSRTEQRTQLPSAASMAMDNLLQGPGIVITLKDSALPRNANQNIGLIHDSDLQRLTEELWTARATAISIGDSIVTRQSVIRCTGPDIFVDGIAVKPPYVVKALGNPDALREATDLRIGVLQQMRRTDPAMVDEKTSESVLMPSSRSATAKQYKVRMRVIRSDMAADGTLKESVIFEPSVTTGLKTAATVNVKLNAAPANEFRIDATPEAETGGMIQISTRLAVIGGNRSGSMTNTCWITHGGKTLVSGVTLSQDPEMHKAAGRGQVLRGHGPYTAYFLEVIVD